MQDTSWEKIQEFNIYNFTKDQTVPLHLPDLL